MVGTRFGCEIGEQPYRGSVPSGAQRLDICIVFGVHTDDQIEPFEILGYKQPGSQIAKVNSARQRRRLHRPVRRIANMPARGSRAIGSVMRRADAKYAFGSRGTADIAQTDKEDTVGHGPRCNA